LPPSRRIRQVVIRDRPAASLYNAPGSEKDSSMNLRRAWFIAACLVPAAIAPAAAQFPPAAPQPQQQQQQTSPCIAEFMRLRDDTQKKANAIRAAGNRKASAKEACGLFNAFTAAEGKMLKYAADNTVWCGIPAQVVEQIKQGHGKTMEIRTKVCNAAANAGTQMAPHAPNLSDILGAPVPDQNNIKTGRGTFDTLTGTPLGSK
jgi:hypothetical protein